VEGNGDFEWEWKGGRDFQVPTHKYNTRSRFFQDFSLWTHIPRVIGLSLSGSARFVTLLLALFCFWAWLWAYRLTRFNCFVLLPPGLMGLWCFKTKFASPVNVDVCNARTSNCAFMHELLKLDDGNCNHFWQSLQILFFFVTERKICKLMKGWK